MTKYKLRKSGVLNTETNGNIPECLDNRDWIEYLEWLAEGNEPEPEFTEVELVEKEKKEEKDKELDMIRKKGDEILKKQAVGELISEGKLLPDYEV